MQINFYLVEINGLFRRNNCTCDHKYIIQIPLCMPRLNSLKFSRYLRIDFVYILNKIQRKNVAESQIRVAHLERHFEFERYYYFLKQEGLKTIEIINDTREDIEGKIWERGDWGGGEFKSRMFTHSRCPRQKSRLRRVFLLFEMFFLVKILKISFQIV